MKPIRSISIVALAVTSASAGHDGAKLRLQQAPAAVQATVTANARGGTLDDFDVITIDGRTIYIAEMELPAELKIYVAESGSLLKTREEIPFQQAPAAVRDTVEALGGTVDETELETSGNTTIYLVEIERRGKPDLDVMVSRTGEILSRSEEEAD